jgi:hypothetical protein
VLSCSATRIENDRRRITRLNVAGRCDDHSAACEVGQLAGRRFPRVTTGSQTSTLPSSTGSELVIARVQLRHMSELIVSMLSTCVIFPTYDYGTPCPCPSIDLRADASTGTSIQATRVRGCANTMLVNSLVKPCNDSQSKPQRLEVITAGAGERTQISDALGD